MVHVSLFEPLSFFCVTYHWSVLLVITSFAFWVPVAISFEHLAYNGIKSSLFCFNLRKITSTFTHVSVLLVVHPGR